MGNTLNTARSFEKQKNEKTAAATVHHFACLLNTVTPVIGMKSYLQWEITINDSKCVKCMEFSSGGRWLGKKKVQVQAELHV